MPEDMENRTAGKEGFAELPPGCANAETSLTDVDCGMQKRLIFAGAMAFAVSYLFWPLAAGILAYCKLIQPGLLIVSGPLAGAACLLLTVFCISGKSVKKSCNILGLQQLRLGSFGWIIPLSVLLAVLTAAVTFGFNELLIRWGIDSGVPGTVEVMSNGGKWQVGIFCCSALLAAPLFEEILFRKILFEMLSCSLGKAAAALLAALAFGAMHFSLMQLPGLVILALVWQTCFLRSRNLLIPVLLHFFNNLLAAVLLLAARFFEWNV